MTIATNARLAVALTLALTLCSAAAAADGDRDSSAVTAGVVLEAVAPAAGGPMQEFLQCRVGCAPKCEGAGNSEQTERCKQRCEMGCNAPAGE